MAKLNSTSKIAFSDGLLLEMEILHRVLGVLLKAWINIAQILFKA